MLSAQALLNAFQELLRVAGGARPVTAWASPLWSHLTLLSPLPPPLAVQLGFLVPTTVIMHAFWAAPENTPEQMAEMINFFKVTGDCV